MKTWSRQTKLPIAYGFFGSLLFILYSSLQREILSRNVASVLCPLILPEQDTLYIHDIGFTSKQSQATIHTAQALFNQKTARNRKKKKIIISQFFSIHMPLPSYRCAIHNSFSHIWDVDEGIREKVKRPLALRYDYIVKSVLFWTVLWAFSTSTDIDKRTIFELINSKISYG